MSVVSPAVTDWPDRAASAAGQATVKINGRDVQVEWTRTAGAELAQRQQPLVVEVELYFSCLVKKFVHFHEASDVDTARGHELVAVTPLLSVFFRPVMSAACSMDDAARLGRQPETEIDSNAVRKMAPKRIHIDHRKRAWSGEVWF